MIISPGIGGGFGFPFYGGGFGSPFYGGFGFGVPLIGGGVVISPPAWSVFNVNILGLAALALSVPVMGAVVRALRKPDNDEDKLD